MTMRGHLHCRTRDFASVGGSKQSDYNSAAPRGSVLRPRTRDARGFDRPVNPKYQRRNAGSSTNSCPDFDSYTTDETPLLARFRSAH